MRLRQLFQPQKTLLDDIRVAARLVSDVLLELKELTKPDMSLDMLDELAERRIREAGGEPYNLNYKPDWAETPYPNTICASVDYEICHSPPRGRVLQAGSIVTYDLGVRYKTGCGDAGLTVAVGEISNRQERTMRYCLRALNAGIKEVRAGVPISRVSRAIEDVCLIHGFNVIREYGGHHIGREMHEKPDIPNKYYPEDDERLLEEGKVICIEPMITPGKAEVAVASDGWTAYVKDQQPVVMFEEMILITAGGYEILTHHLR